MNASFWIGFVGSIVVVTLIRLSLQEWFEKHPITRRQKLNAAWNAMRSASLVCSFYATWPDENEREKARLKLATRIEEYAALESQYKGIAA